MKNIWYYLLFKKKNCFKNTLEQRLNKWTNFVQYGDVYLGNDWWYRKNKK